MNPKLTNNEQLIQRLVEISEQLTAFSQEIVRLQKAVDSSEENEWIVFPTLDNSRIVIRNAAVELRDEVDSAIRALDDLNEDYENERSA